MSEKDEKVKLGKSLGGVFDEVNEEIGDTPKRGSASGARSRLGSALHAFQSLPAGFLRDLKASDKRELARRLSQPILQPKFIPERFFQNVTRSMQWFAAFLLMVIIPASLAIIVAIDQTLVDLFLNGADLGSQSSVLGFLVNLLGMMFFIVAGWSWFIWVKTGGFGLFEI